MLSKDDWWGYSEEHGWVVLDRTLPGNSSRTGKMQFMQCRDWTMYIEDGKNWDPPRYIYAPNFIDSLSVEKQAQAKSEFEWLVEQWTANKEEIKEKCEASQKLAQPEKERKKEFLIECHRMFLEFLRIPYQGVVLTKSNSIRRITHCYSCKQPLDNAIDIECNACHWILCICGACGCGYVRYGS